MNETQLRTDYLVIMVNLLTRRPANNLKCINFIIFILYFCDFSFNLLLDCMFSKFHC